MKETIKLSLLGLLALGLLVSCGKEKDPQENANYTEKAFGLNMEMIYVEGGTFEMGYTKEQGANIPDSMADGFIRITKLDSYHIGKYEVTQAQWKAVMGTTLKEQWEKSNQYQYELWWGLYGEGDNYPMFYISWEEAQAFCQKLSEATGKRYVLPTEAQWEYAARGGGHKTQTRFAGSNNIDDVAWYWENSELRTHRVGTKRANKLGLYDISGNVWEWCSDWFAETYDKSDNYNPQGPVNGSDRVCRGGGWIGDALSCHVSSRYSALPSRRICSLGFRVACISE